MKKLISLLIIVLISTNLFSQVKIADFTTARIKQDYPDDKALHVNTEMNVRFQLFDDKLIIYVVYV